MAARKPSLRKSYDILGLPESATEDEVRKSYRLKARECHPDKNPDDPEATRKFQELGEAYHRIQSGNDDEDDFPDGIDPFVVFVQAMRMQQFMRNLFRAQFSESDDEDEFAFPFGPFGPLGPFGSLFGFSQASDFERRRSRYSDQSGYSRFNSPSWRYQDQQSRSREEPSFRRANMSGREGFQRTSKHKKSPPRRSYDYEPRQAKEPNRGGDRSRKGEETRRSTPRGRSTSDGGEGMNENRNKDCDYDWNFPEKRENCSESSANQGEHTYGSKESSAFDKRFTDVEQDTSFRVPKSKARPKPFPQVKPKKKSKKQQRYEEWRRQEEVAQNLEKEEEIKEGVKETETSSVNTTEQAFQEKRDISKKGGPPVADPSPMKQQEGLAGDSDAVITDKGSPPNKNSSETPTQGTSLGSQKDRPKHYGNGEIPSCEQIQNRYHDNVEGDKEQTKQTQNEGHKEKQRQTAEVISEDLDDVELRGKLQDSSKPNDKPGAIGPAASGQNQRKNRNRRKKAKGTTEEAELKPELLRSMKKGNELREPACGNKTQNSEQHESGQISGDGDALSGEQSQRRRNPKKKVGMDAKKPIMSQNETGTQEQTEDTAGNKVNPTNVKLHERTQNSSQPEENDLFGEVRLGVNKNGQVKPTSRSKAGETNYPKADRSKPRKTDHGVHEFPSIHTYQMHSKRKDYDDRNEQKSPKEKANEGRGPIETSQQQFKAVPKPEKDHVYEPQVYRKPPIENNHDNHQWRTGNKRKARRERKWSSEQHRPTYTGKSVSPETDFWTSVMSPVERASVGSLVPTDELDEQRQLDIALELSKRQF